MLSSANAAGGHLELLLLLWNVFIALRTFTNHQSYVKLIISGPRTTEDEQSVACGVMPGPSCIEIWQLAISGCLAGCLEETRW